MIEEYIRKSDPIRAVKFTGDNLDEIVYELHAPVIIAVSTREMNDYKNSVFWYRGRRMLLFLAAEVGETADAVVSVGDYIVCCNDDFECMTAETFENNYKKKEQ